MCGTEIIEFSSFTLEVNKASQKVWGFKREPFEKDIHEVAMCLKGQISAYPLYEEWANFVNEQLYYRLRKRRVLVLVPWEFEDIFYLDPKLDRMNDIQLPEVLLSFTSRDTDLWLSLFRDKEILSRHNVPRTTDRRLDHRFHLIPFAQHLRVRKLI